MADTVKVKSLRFHTYNGIDRPEGTVYEIDPEHPETLETLEATGMAQRVTADEPPAKKEPARPPRRNSR
jgi:hypothetical protein